jgi:predicted ferric reductase
LRIKKAMRKAPHTTDVAAGASPPPAWLRNAAQGLLGRNPFTLGEMVLTGPGRPSLGIPLIALLTVGALVAWAWPEKLALWRTGGIVSGWVGSGLLLVSLLLMVREPWLARTLGGLAPMYRWHHVLGVWAYVVLLAHPLAFAAHDWSESPAIAWAMLSPWQQSWPIWLGWASLLGMMAGLMVALWPRLRYAAWRRWHHLLSLSVLFGAAHLVGLGLDGVLFAAPLLVIAFLLWRLLRADHGLGAQPYVVQRVAHLSPSTVELTLQPLARPLKAAPGQFVLAAFFDGPQYTGCGEYHPYTISAAAPDGHLALGIKALGDCTRQLQAIHPGAAVRIQGPFGDFLGAGTGPALWVAGGIGITPFMAALRQGPLTRPVRLIYLHREGADAPYAPELHRLAALQPALVLQLIDTGQSLPDLGHILPGEAQLQGLDCYLCGPSAMVDAAAQLLRQRGVQPPRIHFERFDFR